MTLPTPGPWTAQDDGTGRIDYVHADGVSIAEDIGGRTVEEVEANAHLIAVAPEIWKLLCAAVANEMGWRADAEEFFNRMKAEFSSAERQE